MMLIGEDPRKHIANYSRDFEKTFIELLRTTHGTKSINANHFYQQIVSDKEHIHMNSTQWKSLSQFVAHLGREGKCRVEDTEKGLFIAWIDNSPETLRRREAVLKKERQEKGDEEREQRQIKDQIKRAAALAKPEEEDPEEKLLQRKEGEKMKLDFHGLGAKKTEPKPDSATTTTTTAPGAAEVTKSPESTDVPAEATDSPAASAPAPVKLSMSMGPQKPKNVFAAAKKNPLAGKKGSVLAPPKKMTEQERIMKAEMEAMERKRSRPESGFMNKRPKMA
ncbi:unnamed protein product [Penicillium olsonii]|nr:unnamed protein product [Penicillium olsonii]